MPKILIVEDNLVSLMELEELLQQSGYGIAGTAENGLQAVRLALNLKPDLILMDIKLPGKMDGITAAEIIKSKMKIPIVYLTGHSEPEFLERAGKTNPHGFILKPYNGNQIKAAIEIALQVHENQGDQTFLVPHAEEGNAPSNGALESSSPLTISELKVARLIHKGFRTKEIAEHLDVSQHTVSWHRKNIRSKLGLYRRKESLLHALGFCCKAANAFSAALKIPGEQYFSAFSSFYFQRHGRGKPLYLMPFLPHALSKNPY